MFNVLETAMSVITEVCPTADITFTLNSQIQRHHRDPLQPSHHENKLTINGLIQASTNTNQLLTNHINSGRLYKLYIVNTDLDILSYTQNSAYHLTATFVYNKREIEVQVIGCEDCKYNGWVRLDCTEMRRPLHPYGSPVL